MEHRTDIDALASFARLYGYVRFFYPGDEAVDVPWDDYAAAGVTNVLKSDDLMSCLQDWLAPIASGASIYPEGGAVPALELPESDVVVAWRHIGLELDLEYWPYRSERTNRPRTRPLPDDHTPVSFAEEQAQIGDVLQVSIGSGLLLQLPLALPSVNGRTVPEPTSERSTETAEPSDEALWLATIVVAWNVFQHSYPYFEVLDVDWLDMLHRTIADVVHASNRSEFRSARDRMLVPLADGHASIYDTWWFAMLPVKLDYVESEVVVVASGCDVPVGARALTYNGEQARDVFARQVAHESGSERYRRERALRKMDRPTLNAVIELTYETESNVARAELKADHEDYPPSPSHPGVVAEIESGVWYIDGLDIELEQLDAHLPELQSARRIIVDFRGYPSKHACDLLGHFIQEPVWCGLWQIPLFIRPDRDFLGYSDDGRWQVEPREPYLEAERVFLTGPGAISYGETVMEIVEQANMGTIVGEATAATNGNVNKVVLPDKSIMMFTGMKVLKKDGSQLHLVGVQPDVAATPTIQGIGSGRDEVLQVAVELPRQKGESSNRVCAARDARSDLGPELSDEC